MKLIMPVVLFHVNGTGNIWPLAAKTTPMGAEVSVAAAPLANTNGCG